MDVRQRIRHYIKNHGMRINFVAQKSGIPEKRFYRILNGTSPLTADEYESICKGLSLDPSYFFRNNFSENENKTTRTA